MRKRPRRVAESGLYHFGSRGSNQERIYYDGLDYDIWVRLFAQVARLHDWTVLAWTQMPNHFHAIARAENHALSNGMQQLNYRYSRRTNARHDRNAHLFENRFWSEPLETREHALTAVGYVDVNAYKSKRRIHPRDWIHGSFRAAAGYVHPPSFLAVGELLALFSADPATARARYRAFVFEAMTRVDMTRSQATATELSRRAS
jgi:REP element-mobilizing transposase RayT